ncbi:MAG: hypothetical protein PVJ21_20110 [Anaerolineales bacterium]|jgi:hypothetical protein
MKNKKQIMTDVIYHIRVKGLLDEKWTAWFDGLEISPQENGETLLSGALTDQSELFGMLTKINNLGLILLSLKRKEK